MKIQYTHGPWHVGMNPGPFVYGPKGGQIADCRSISNEECENDYNARLIAAAPTLLEAAQFASEILRVLVKNNPTKKHYADAYLNLATAIGIAEGKIS